MVNFAYEIEEQSGLTSSTWTSAAAFRRQPPQGDLLAARCGRPCHRRVAERIGEALYRTLARQVSQAGHRGRPGH